MGGSNHKGYYKMEQVTEDVIMEAEFRVMPLLERGPQVKKYRQPLEAG